jgi:hypothetical protein
MNSRNGKARAITVAGLVLVGVAAVVVSRGLSTPQGEGAQADNTNTASVTEAPAPDPSGLTERAAERWGMIAAGDWIQVYEFNNPAYRATQGLYEFLDGKHYHHYRDPSQPELIALEGDQAYLRTGAYWKPSHPMVIQARGGEDIEDFLEMVETWEWAEGAWYFLKNDRRSDFYGEHPDLLKR